MLVRKECVPSAKSGMVFGVPLKHNFTIQFETQFYYLIVLSQPLSQSQFNWQHLAPEEVQYRAQIRQFPSIPWEE